MIYTIANQKGGVGKTTTALSLASGLAREGRRVLIIDLDAQANTTTTLRAKQKQGSTYELLTGLATLDQIIQSTKEPGLCIAPASGRLATADIDIKGAGRESKLRGALSKVKGEFEDVVIDTPPTLGILTINALVASDSLIIPTTLSPFAFDGIKQTIENFKAVKFGAPSKKQGPLNPALSLGGFLITLYAPKTNLSRELALKLEEMAQKFDSKIFKTRIRNSVKVGEAQTFGELLSDFAPKSTTNLDYTNFIKEVLNNG